MSELFVPAPAGLAPRGFASATGPSPDQFEASWTLADLIHTDDVITGTEGADSIVGTAGADVIYGLGGPDTINGGYGDDTLIGGNNDDRLYGAQGRNTASYADSSSAVDIVLQSYSGTATSHNGSVDDLGNIEGVIGTAFADNITVGIEFVQVVEGQTADGGAGDDVITADVIDATLLGGEGDDIIHAGTADMSIDGGEGSDSIYLAEQLRSKAAVEGGAGDDVIYLSTSNGTLDGGDGLDTLDVSILDRVKINMASLGGQRLGHAGVHLSSIEGLIATDGNDVVKGSAADNVITAGAGDDRIHGNDGADSLDGGAGKDQLVGGKGADILVGGTDADILTGGADVDVFAFRTMADSPADVHDTIRDLTDADVIDLSAIDANTLKLGDQAFALVEALDGHAGQAALVVVNKHLTQLVLDVDGDATADMTINISGDHGGFTNFVL